MSLFARIDQDGIPDTQSYYDNGFSRRSKFKTKREAIEVLSDYYWHTEERELSRQAREYLLTHIARTSPGYWGLPTAPGVLFGFLVQSGSIRLMLDLLRDYWEPKSYLQIFEGIPVNDYNPVRKLTNGDGDQFIPTKVLCSHQVLYDMKTVGYNEFSQIKEELISWFLGQDYSVSPEVLI